VLAADKALDSGNADALVKLITDAATEGLAYRFAEAHKLREHADHMSRRAGNPWPPTSNSRIMPNNSTPSPQASRCAPSGIQSAPRTGTRARSASPVPQGLSTSALVAVLFPIIAVAAFAR